MSEVGVEPMPLEQHIATLRVRLRVETAGWHDRVEAVADLPGWLRTRNDYVAMLWRLYELHSSLEDAIAAPRFHEAWHRVGVDMPNHRRAHLLAMDLTELGATTPPRSLGSAPLDTFGHALGCLYVLEGSSLGGRTVARLVTAALGEVPTTFLTGDGRSGSSPWLSVCNALARFEARDGDGDAVIAGACATFAAFADHLGQQP